MRMVSLGHAARNKAGIKVRQPLARALFKARNEKEADSLQRLAPQIADELNTKQVGLLSEVDDVADYAVTAIPAVVGKKYGALFPRIRVALGRADGAELARLVQNLEPVALTVEGGVVHRWTTYH